MRAMSEALFQIINAQLRGFAATPELNVLARLPRQAMTQIVFRWTATPWNPPFRWLRNIEALQRAAVVRVQIDERFLVPTLKDSPRSLLLPRFVPCDARSDRTGAVTTDSRRAS